MNLNIYFDNHHQPKPAKLYLGTPTNKVLYAINGVIENSCVLTPNINNTWSLTFDVNRFILYKDNGRTKEAESYVYLLLDQKMRVYVENIGWFIMSPPVVHGEAYKEYKTISAESAEIEFQQHDLKSFKINQGTTDSLEMLADGNVEIIDDVEFAKEQIKFYNPNNPQLSLLDLAMKASGLYGWTVGYIDKVPKTYKYYEDGELKEKTTLLSDEVGSFDIESQDLYSFFTQDMAKFFEVVFVFDFKRFVINAYHPENLGKDTNINIGFHNLQQSHEISADDSNMFTRYYVQGQDDLGITYVNFGHNYIEDISYYLNEKYLSPLTIWKYNLWKDDVETRRPSYIENTRLYNKQMSVISELYDRVPLDDCSTDWSTFTDDELREAQANYKAQLKGYESFYVDKNGNFDEDALKASVDANDYYQIKDVILPSIEIEFANRELPTDDDKADYVDTWKTNWKLYGLDELQVKLDEYQNIIDICEKNGYSEPYSDESSHTKDTHEAMYEKYLDAKNQLDPDFVDGCKEAYDQRQTEIDSAKATQKEYDDVRKAIAESVEKETWEHILDESEKYLTDEEGNYIVDEEGNRFLLSQEILPFTEDELLELSKLYIDGDYTNENMFLVDSDDQVSAIDEQLKLLNAAQDDLYISAHPQYTYTTSLDNFLAKYDYKNYTDQLNVGDYIHLSTGKNKIVKLRVVSMEYYPMIMDNNLSISFSNMIQSKSSRSDTMSLLDSSAGGSKTSASGNSNNFLNNEGVTLTAGLIQKLISSGAFSNKVSQIVNNEFAGIIAGGSGTISISDLNAKMIQVTDIIGENGFFEYLQSKLITTDKIIAESGEFKTLSALVAAIDNLLAGNISAEIAHIIKLTAENVQIDEAVIRDLIAANITVSMLKASDISTDKFHIVSEDGGVEIIGNTMQFKDSNDVVRIQIGRDATDNFTFCLYDETGQGVLIDSTGVKESAISDGLIKNDMLADNSISKDKLNFSIVEPDENGNIDAGKVVINGKGIDVEFTSIRESIESVKKDISEIEPSFNIVMSNESQNIPCDNNGLTSLSLLIEIPFIGFVGMSQTSCSATVGVLPTGMTLGTIEDATDTTSGKVILNISQNANLGGDDILTGTIPITFTINGKEIVKNFNWTKSKMGDPGQAGASARIFELNASSLVVKKNKNGDFIPNTITFSSSYREGNSTKKQSYLGRFIVKESPDGSTYSTKYMSIEDEDSIVYNISTDDVESIQCILCSSGGVSNQLDEQTVVVLSDSNSLSEEIKEIKTSMSGMSSKVDAVEKSIDSKIWQSDINTKIQEYDNSEIKIVRDQLAETKSTIGNISSTVSDVQSTLEKKADGSTVQKLSEKVSQNEQTAEGFRQTVENNYVTNDSMKSALSSAISESAKEIKLEVSETYETKDNVNTIKSDLTLRADEIAQSVEDANGNISRLQQTSEQIQQSVESANGEISNLKQDAESFKTEVSQKYLSKDALTALSVGGRNLLRNSNTLYFKDYEII